MTPCLVVSSKHTYVLQPNMHVLYSTITANPKQCYASNPSLFQDSITQIMLLHWWTIVSEMKLSEGLWISSRLSVYQLNVVDWILMTFCGMMHKCSASKMLMIRPRATTDCCMSHTSNDTFCNETKPSLIIPHCAAQINKHIQSCTNMSTHTLTPEYIDVLS